MEMKDLRVMAIGAHPDDADVNMAGTLSKFAAAGARVKMVAMTNGNKGHRTMPPDELAERRLGEAQASAKVIGAEEYVVMGSDDCVLEPTLEWRRRLTHLVRSFAPHLIFTHRTCDYHADHRAAGVLVQDITYFLGVPYWCPETPVPDVAPAVFFMRDKFTVPRELRPDVAVDITDVQDIAADALCCHVSQFFEWLPPELPGAVEANPGPDAPVEDRRAFVKRFWFARKQFDAARFNLPWQYAEVFELSEYGRQPDSDEIRSLFPAGAVVAERKSSGWR
jgi:LmbE family N-acetylglucosaminyl deacetylase